MNAPVQADVRRTRGQTTYGAVLWRASIHASIVALRSRPQVSWGVSSRAPAEALPSPGHPMPASSPAQRLRARGLPWFEDVLGAVPGALAGVDPAGRTAFALWCAERAWRTAPPVLSGVAASVDWSFLLHAMWRSVERRNRDAMTKVESMLGVVERGLAEADDSATGALDQDAIAACIYAARCYATGEAESARWAATVWLDAVFEQLNSDGNLEEDAARPEVQQALGDVQAAIAYVQQPGAEAATLRNFRP